MADESITEKVERLVDEGAITPNDRDEIRAFQRFLEMVGEAPTDEQGRKIIGKEWRAYIDGGGAESAPEPEPYMPRAVHVVDVRDLHHLGPAALLAALERRIRDCHVRNIPADAVLVSGEQIAALEAHLEATSDVDPPEPGGAVGTVYGYPMWTDSFRPGERR